MCQIKMWKTGLLRSCRFFPIVAILLILGEQHHVQANVNNHLVGVHRRFEYKYSFKPPYLAQKDGTVPFWEYGGSKYTNKYKVTA